MEDRKLTQIEGVRVLSSCRGQGKGDALIQLALDRAKVKGCRIVKLTTNHSRADAIRLYQSLGFKEIHIGFRLKLI